jgi:hypothetical protein
MVFSASDYTVVVKKILRQQEGSEEKGLACDTLQHVAVGHTQRGVRCL